MEDHVPWINSLLEKGRNLGPCLPRCHLCCAGADLACTDCVKSPALQTFPNLPFTSLPPLQFQFSTMRETSGRSTYQQDCPTWEGSWGSNSCSGFESPWQMFAIPAPSLILETKPLIIPDQSTLFLIDSQRVFIQHNPPLLLWPLTFKKTINKKK